MATKEMESVEMICTSGGATTIKASSSDGSVDIDWGGDTKSDGTYNPD